MVATIRMMLILGSLLVTLISMSTSVKSQDLCRINIITKSEYDFSPLAGVKVLLSGTNVYIGYTNESGIISFNAEATHTYEFILEKSGFYTEYITAKCWPNQSYTVYAYLQPLSNQQEIFYVTSSNEEQGTTNEADFYVYFPTNFIEMDPGDEKTIDLYVCSKNDFYGIVYVNAIHSNGIKVDVPSILEIPKNSCIIEKVDIKSTDSYGDHYLYVYVKQRDELAFSNRINIFVEKPEDYENTLHIIPSISLVDSTVEKGDMLLVKNEIKVEGIDQKVYITAKLKVDDKLIERKYFIISEDSTINFYSTINTAYFSEGYHYAILEVYTNSDSNSTVQMFKIVSYYTQENNYFEPSNTYLTENENAGNHCLEFVDIKNKKVEINKTSIIPIVIHNCGSTEEKNIVIKMIFDGRVLINTIDEIKPNDYKVAKIHFYTRKPFGEKIARIIAYNENISIDAGFKLFSASANIHVLLKDSYKTDECSEKVINVKIANSGLDEYIGNIDVFTNLNYTISKKQIVLKPKETVSIPITFKIPCNVTESYLVKVKIGDDDYYTTIEVVKNNRNYFGSVLAYVLLAILLSIILLMLKYSYPRRIKCWVRHKDELLF